MFSREKRSNGNKELLSVPQNFIPGLTKPRLSIQPDTDEFQQPSRKVSSICYQGVQVKVKDDPNLPEKLLVQAGLIALSLPAPSRHMNCSEKASHFNVKSYDGKKYFHRFHKASNLISHKTLDRRSTMPTLTDTNFDRKKSVGRTRSETVECGKYDRKAVADCKVQYTIENLSPTKSNSLPELDNLPVNDKDDFLSEDITVAIPLSVKRRSRSFSSGLNYPPELITPKVKRKIGLAISDSFKNGDEQLEKETLDTVQKTLREKLPKTFRVTASIGLLHPMVASKSVQQDQKRFIQKVSSPNLHPNDESNKKWNFKKFIQKGSPKLIRNFKSFDETASRANQVTKSPIERRRSNFDVTDNMTSCERPSSPFTRAKTYSNRSKGEGAIRSKYQWNSFDDTESRIENRGNFEKVQLLKDNNNSPLKSIGNATLVYSTRKDIPNIARTDDIKAKPLKQNSLEWDKSSKKQIGNVGCDTEPLDGNCNEVKGSSVEADRSKEIEEEISKHLKEINDMFELE